MNLISKINKLLMASCLLLISACQSQAPKEKNFSTMPESRFSTIESDKSKLVLAISGSLADGLEDSIEKGSENINPLLQFKVGGLSNLLRYLKIFNEKLANEGLTIGHGPLINQSATWSDLKNKLSLAGKLPYDLLSITDREILTSWVGTNDPSSIWNINNLHLSNIYDSQTLLPNEKQGFGVVLSKNKKDVFISSLISIDATDDSFKTNQRNFYLENPTLNFLKAWQQVRKEKRPHLSIVLFTARGGCNFEPFNVDVAFGQLKSLDANCPKGSELVEFINRAPPNSIDLVIINGNEPGVGKINNIPVVQVDRKNRYLNFVEFVFDANNVLSPTASTYFAPTKLCSKFHAQHDHCDVIAAEQNTNPWRGQVPTSKSREARFLGEKIDDDSNELDNLVTSR